MVLVWFVYFGFVCLLGGSHYFAFTDLLRLEKNLNFDHFSNTRYSRRVVPECTLRAAIHVHIWIYRGSVVDVLGQIT